MFNKALLPILLFFTTVSLGVVLLFVVLRLTSTRSVTPTTPEPSGATNACVTDVIKIKDLNHLVCENNTCTQKPGAGTNACQTANQYQGCFQCRTLTANKTAGRPPLAVEFTALMTSQKNVNSFEFDFGDGSAKRTVQVTNPANPTKVSHTYTTEGTFSATLTAISTNATGQAIRDTNTSCGTTITVTREQVELKCNSLTVNPQTGNKPLQVSLSGSGQGEGTLQYEFSFGDATQAVKGTANTVTHTYQTEGTYTAKLYVWSGANKTSEIPACVKTVTVTTPGKYLKCDNEQCKEFTKVTGNETNQCDADNDCKEETPKHSVCSNMQCKEVDGAGNDECDADADCYKYSCVNESCSKVEGEGADSCNSDSDCEPADNGNNPTHLACKNQACVRVSGEGENQCSVNSDCATVAETPAKPVVPKTGSSGNTPIYLLIAGAFIALGGVLIRKRFV